MKLLVAGIVSSSLTLAAIAAEGESRGHPSEGLIEEKVTVQGLDGTALDMTQILRPNADGTYTVARLEPESEVEAFFERQCASLGAEWAGLDDGETILTEGAIYGFTCEDAHAIRQCYQASIVSGACQVVGQPDQPVRDLGVFAAQLGLVAVAGLADAEHPTRQPNADALFRDGFTTFFRWLP